MGDKGSGDRAVPPGPPGPPGPLDRPPLDDAATGGLTLLVGLAVLGGVLAGLLGGSFRWVLIRADTWRDSLLGWTDEAPAARWLVPVVLAAVAVALARWLVRLAPDASGSGIQEVEAAARGEVATPSIRVVPVKYVGGVLALGSGLALGREGPTVQMAAALGTPLARWRRLGAHDTRTLSVALAGAGLGVAFNAPMGGALFAFEEVAHAFRTKLVIATLVATGVGVSTATLLVGRGPIFLVERKPDAGPLWHLAAFAAVAVLLGAAGVAYNRVTIACLDLVARIRSVPPEIPAACIGAAVGLIGVLDPDLIGGGDELSGVLLVSTVPLGTLALWFVVRWVLGPISYAAGTPGGLFSPLLLVGAAGGALIAGAVNAVAPAASLDPTAFALVGMSTFFAAVVRAPVTGVVLIMEMTMTTSLVVPMAIAAAVATWTATMLRGEPIYDTLRARMRPDG